WRRARGRGSADLLLRFCAIANPPTTATTIATVAATYASRRSVSHRRRGGATSCALRACFALRPLTDSSGGERGSGEQPLRRSGKRRARGQETSPDDEQDAKPAAYQLRCGDQVCGCAARSPVLRSCAQRYVIRRVLVGDENLQLLRPTPACAWPDSCAAVPPPARSSTTATRSSRSDARDERQYGDKGRRGGRPPSTGILRLAAAHSRAEG